MCHKIAFVLACLACACHARDIGKEGYADVGLTLDMPNITISFLRSIQDDYFAICDVHSPSFELNNMRKLKKEKGFEKKAFSSVSVLCVLQAILMLGIAIILPPKFPVSPWQEWRAPKKSLLDACKRELEKVDRLPSSDPQYYAYFGRENQKKVIQNVVGKLNTMTTQSKRLQWSKDDEEFSAKQIHTLVEEFMQGFKQACPNEELEITSLGCWLTTTLFRGCFEPQDKYHMLSFNLAVADQRCYEFDGDQTKHFIELRLNQPAVMVGVSLPWSTAMQVVIAACGTLHSALAPFWVLYEISFWLYYTPEYFPLTFRLPLIMEFVLNILRGWVSQKAWDCLTANQNSFVLCETFPWFWRFSGGPFRRMANIPLYSVAMQTALQVYLLPSIIMWSIFFGVPSAIWVLVMQILMGTCFKKSPENGLLAEPLLTPKSSGAARSWITGIIQRAKDMWYSATPDSRALCIAIVSLPMPLGALLPAMSIVMKLVPDTSATYLCNYSRIKVISLNMSSVAGSVFAIIVLSAGVGFLIFSRYGTSFLKRFMDLERSGIAMVTWVGVQSQFPENIKTAVEKYDLRIAEKEEDYTESSTRFSERVKQQYINEYMMPRLKNQADCLLQVPGEILTEALCMEVVKHNGFALQYLPADKKTEAVCKEAVKQDRRALKYVPEDKKTEVCKEAVKQNGDALKYVPEDKKTEAVCMEAVKQDGYALEYVPEDKRTEAVCMVAVKQDWHALQYVPKDKKTEAFCMQAVKQNRYALRLVPKDKRTEAVCMEAVKQSTAALEVDVPEDKKTEAVCKEAVKQNGDALLYVPKDKKTEAVCKEAVKQNGYALQYVPEDKKTEALCMEAVKQDGYTLKFVPKDKKTEAMCMEAVKQPGDALLYVPKDKKTEAVCMEAVKQNGVALQYVPEDKKTEAVCMEAVKQNGYALQYVPEDKRTEAVCMEAVKQNGYALKYVPEDKKTEAVCMEAGVKYPEAIRLPQASL